MAEKKKKPREICAYIISRGPRKGQRCTRGVRNNGMCYRHENSKFAQELRKLEAVKFLNEDDVFGNGIEQVEQTNNNSKFSLYLITINTQRDIRKISRDDKIKFRELGRWLFGSQEGLQENEKPAILDFIEARDENWRDRIIDLQTKHHYEIGTGTRKLHMHAVLRIEHSTRITFRPSKLRQVLREIFGYNLHVSSPASTDPYAYMQRYVEKHNVADIPTDL